MAAVAVLVASVVLSVLRSLVTYGNLVLRRDADLLHLEHGLLRVREHTFDMRRLRGGTLREPLLVRMFGGARLDAVMTVWTARGRRRCCCRRALGRPPRRCCAELIARPDVVTGPLRGHGAVATRRRWTRAFALPAVLLIAMAALYSRTPLWLWPAWAVLTVCCALLAVDRSRALGHRVDAEWLGAGGQPRQAPRLHCRGGNHRVDGAPDAAAAAGGGGDVVAATAAGVKAYQVLDVPAELAWTIAAEASPWVADNDWATPT